MGITNFTGHTDDDDANNTGMPSQPFGIPIDDIDGEPDVSDLLINYNDKYNQNGDIMFRDEVVQQTLAVLIGKDKPNALLIGPAGVGKTKIVENIAYRLANDDYMIPDKLKGHTVYELPLSNIVAGASLVGQIEKKIKSVIGFASDPDNKAILFIDEIHQLVSSSNATYEKIAQILKPALARGEIKVIGATTTQEAGMLIDDPAFNRRFSRLIVDEFTQEQTVEILKKAIPVFFKHYSNKIQMSDDLMPKVVSIADRYSTAGSHRPDNALTLLDRTIGEAVIQRKIMEHRAAQSGDQSILQALKSIPLIPITEKQLKTTAVKLMTGHAKKDGLDENKLRTSLSSIKGQDDIIESVIKLLKQYDLQLFPQNTPLTMLFAGTSGVGKTEVTKIIAEEMTGMKPITLNMTEYNSSASINRIIGAPAGYVGSDSHAELPFDILESNPYQVILLDEFEKCDKSVQRLFMSAFEEGYIKTNNGKTIDFSKAIIIATTNAGHKHSERTLGFVQNTNEKTMSSTVSDLSDCFDMELLNRFQSNIFTFHELNENVYKDIIINIYTKELSRIRSENRKINLPDTIPDDELNGIVKKTYIPDFGARPAYSAVKEYIYSHA